MSELQLQRSIQATFVNLGKREIEDQWLDSGTFIADVSFAEDVLGNRMWYFVARNPNGNAWYDYRSYENPEE